MLWHKLQGAAGVGGEIIQYVGGYTEGFAGTTSNKVITFGGNLTGGLDSSASEGDFVLVWFGTGSDRDRNLNVSGYTEIVELRNGSFSQDSDLVVAYKFMGATPDTTVTLTGGTGDAADAGAVVIHVFRNVDTTTPMDVTRTTSTGGATVGTRTVDPPAITPVTSKAWIVVGAAGGLNSTNVFSSSQLANFLSTNSQDSSDVVVGAGYYSSWTSGSFDTPDFSGGVVSYVSVSVALRPATP